MIRTEQIKAVSVEMLEALTPHAADEYAAARREIANDQVFAVYDDDTLLLILGIAKRGFLMPAEVWVLLGKAYGPKYAKRSKQVAKVLIHRYGGLYTLINVESVPACRFAQFFGFRPRGNHTTFEGRTFQLYEVYP